MVPAVQRLRSPLLPALLAVAFAMPWVMLTNGCGGETICERSSEPTESQRCMQRGSPTAAVLTAGGAAAAWPVVGCRVNGCHLPFSCNEESGLCERRHCNEGYPCPSSWECNVETHECE